MLNKQPQPAYKRWIKTTFKTVLIAEVLGIAVSYGVWYKLNTDRDFRLYMHKNYNWVLDGYYGLGELVGGFKTREFDKTVWESEGKIERK